jgi:hypothetical protein
VSNLGYYVDLHASADSLDQDTKNGVANAVREFVMSKPKPFRQGRVTTCIIYFYERGEEYEDQAFSFQMNRDGYSKYSTPPDHK